MAKCYEYSIVGTWRFEVTVREIVKGRQVVRQHIVSKVKGKWHCDCLGFQYSSPLLKVCNHIKYINERIQEQPSKFFRNTEEEFDWKDLNELARRFG